MVPEGFADDVAAELLGASFVSEDVDDAGYPRWSRQSASDGDATRSGVVYFDGAGAWVIWVHSAAEDYSKMYVAASTRRSVPRSAVWTDTATQEGMSQSTYRLVMQCGVAGAVSTTRARATQAARSESEVVYGGTVWVVVAVLCLVLLVAGVVLLRWWVARRRQQEVRAVNAEEVKANAVALRGRGGEDLVSAAMPDVTPKASVVPTYSAMDPAAGSPTVDGDRTTTGGLDWDDENVWSV